MNSLHLSSFALSASILILLTPIFLGFGQWEKLAGDLWIGGKVILGYEFPLILPGQVPVCQVSVLLKVTVQIG